jgi:ABC-type uncharacterized transport system involved in gliding motility auxiliary subunit
MTEDQSNSLAPETIKMLAALPQPITIRAYYSSRVSRDTIQKMLDDFKQHSNGKLTYGFSDLYQDPYAAQQDGISHDSTILLQMGTHKEISSLGTEQDIDSAIVRLINPQSRVVYFVTGHGELDTQSALDASLTQVRTTLQNKNYTVKLLNLGTVGKVPADAKVVIEAGPQQALTSDQAKLLQDYVTGGGGLIVMEDPAELTKIGTADDPLADMLATSFNITLQHDVVIDTDTTNPLFAYSDVQNYGQHPITQSLAGVDTIFYATRSLKLGTPPASVTLTPLAQTYSTDKVWGETDFKSLANHQVGFDPAADLAAPLTLAAAWEDSAGKGRLVVFGNSQFATDALYKQGYGDILINSVDWASSQVDLISLTPKNNIARTYVPPTTTVMIGIFLLSLCVIPLLVVLAGFAAWYSRRRRG